MARGFMLYEYIVQHRLGDLQARMSNGVAKDPKGPSHPNTGHVLLLHCEFEFYSMLFLVTSCLGSCRLLVPLRP